MGGPVVERTRIAAQNELDLRNDEAYRRRFANPRESLRLADGIAARAEQAGYLRGLGYALRTHGAAQCLMSALDDADAALARAEAIFRSLEDERGATHVLLWQGNVAARRGDHAAAIETYLLVLSRFRAQGDVEGEISALHMLSGAYLRVSEINRARQFAAEARRLAEERGDRMHLAVALMNLASFAGEEREYERSIELLSEARALFRQIGDVTNEAVAVGNTGVTLRRMGRYDEALAHLELSLSVFRDQHLHGYAIAILDELSAAHQTMDDLDAALACSVAAVELASSVGESMRHVFASIRMGELLLLRGESVQAERVLLEALERARAGGLIAPESEAHRVLSAVFEARGDLTRALAHFKAHHESQLRTRAAEAEALRRDRQDLEEVAKVRRNAELQAAHAELRVLKAQMQPHFLLNALSSIATLLPRDPAEASRMVLDLADLLHLALRQSSTQEVRLRDEIEFVRLYAAVEQTRRAGSIQLDVHVAPEAADETVPHLLLQPFVENAIHHGMGGNARLTIRIDVQVEPEGMLAIRVEDDGAGLPPDWSPARTGVGLRNTMERLRLLYRAKQALRVEPAAGGGTVVTIHLPVAGCLKTAHTQPAEREGLDSADAV